MIIVTLVDAQLTNKDIYLTYINFQNAFSSIDNARLLALMEDLGLLPRRRRNRKQHLQKFHHILH